MKDKESEQQKEKNLEINEIYNLPLVEETEIKKKAVNDYIPTNINAEAASKCIIKVQAWARMKNVRNQFLKIRKNKEELKKDVLEIKTEPETGLKLYRKEAVTLENNSV